MRADSRHVARVMVTACLSCLPTHARGRTWVPGNYVSGQGTADYDTAICYPSRVVTKDGGLIIVVANHVGGKVARLDAVHWRLLGNYWPRRLNRSPCPRTGVAPSPASTEAVGSHAGLRAVQSSDHAVAPRRICENGPP